MYNIHNDQIKEDKVGGTCSRHGKKGKYIKIGRKTQLKPRHKREDNIKMDVKEM
jgi:hypothetical protein